MVSSVGQVKKRNYPAFGRVVFAVGFALVLLAMRAAAVVYSSTGNISDAGGNPPQSHLIYAANSAQW